VAVRFSEPRAAAAASTASLNASARSSSSFQISTSKAVTGPSESRWAKDVPSARTGAKRAITSLPRRAAIVAASAS
jgi:hypothetical protein